MTKGSTPSAAGSSSSPTDPPAVSAASPQPTSSIPTAATTKTASAASSVNGGFQRGRVLLQPLRNVRDFYTVGKKIGQGQFGTTYVCIDKSTGQEFACKSIPKRKLICLEDCEDVRREIQIMHHLAGHPNVVRIRGPFEDALFVHLVMELCAGGELFDRIIQKGHYSERKAAGIIRTIVGVVHACHASGVMHRDLKPENFLFADSGENAPLKTTDFGLSVFYEAGDVFCDVVGSPYYVAPERKRYGPEADVWSAGVILYILLSGVAPFWAETEQGIFRQILQSTLDFQSEPWPGISESAKDLIGNMLNRNPKKRFTARQVLMISRLKQFSAMNKLKKMALRVIAESLSEEEIGGLKEIFHMIDTDNSGTITFDELKAGLRKVGSELMESEIRSLMEADGRIDYAEFSAMMRKGAGGVGKITMRKSMCGFRDALKIVD